MIPTLNSEPAVILCGICGDPSNASPCAACRITAMPHQEDDAPNIAAEAQTRDQDALRASWRALNCPPNYASTQWAETTLHPGLSPKCATLARQWWSKDGLGLLMHGASGTGKTRAAWDILRRHHFARRWRCGFVKVFQFNQWAHDTSSRTARDREEARTRITAAKKVDLLVLDDLGTEPDADQTFAGHLWDLLEVRTSWNRPTIVTTEHIGETLTRRFLPSAQTDAARILRRLREFCDSHNVNFTH